jgi:hypothetical protein
MKEENHGRVKGELLKFVIAHGAFCMDASVTDAGAVSVLGHLKPHSLFCTSFTCPSVATAVLGGGIDMISRFICR